MNSMGTSDNDFRLMVRADLEGENLFFSEHCFVLLHSIALCDHISLMLWNGNRVTAACSIMTVSFYILS